MTSSRAGRRAVWQYQGRLLQGPPNTLQTLPDSDLGPILRLRRGQMLKVHFENQINEPSTIHWHGLSVPDEMDGHPRHAIEHGQSYTYEFPILNRAGTYWFHPHPHQRTGPQVYYGLAGLLIVSDDEELPWVCLPVNSTCRWSSRIASSTARTSSTMPPIR